VKLLLDTHLLLWAAENPNRLSATARDLIADPANEPLFSAASLWEIGIKFAQGRQDLGRQDLGRQDLGRQDLGRQDFTYDPRSLRRDLLDHGYTEVPVTGEHANAVLTLPRLHRDPFDRLLIAQSIVEGIILLTADPTMARYPGLVRLV
jgi:PIN domain nuclease of toxin-antitoxin system